MAQTTFTEWISAGNNSYWREIGSTNGGGYYATFTTPTGHDHSMSLWTCVASDTGCVMATKSCNGTVLNSGNLEILYCGCRAIDACSECVMNAPPRDNSGRWDWEKAIVPACP